MMEESDQPHFDAIPWCSNLISDPNFIVTPTWSRQPKTTTEDSLFAETLRTSSTISRCLSSYRKPHGQDECLWTDEVRTLTALGSGLNGSPDVLHGGIVATLMDDCIGTLLTVNKHQKKPLSSSTVTAYLNVQYLQPVTTPQTVLVVAKARDVKGRKYYMDAEIRNSKEVVLAKAESLWIRLDKSKSLIQKKLTVGMLWMIRIVVLLTNEAPYIESSTTPCLRARIIQVVQEKNVLMESAQARTKEEWNAVKEKEIMNNRFLAIKEKLFQHPAHRKNAASNTELPDFLLKKNIRKRDSS